jgi:hypothetical protein
MLLKNNEGKRKLSIDHILTANRTIMVSMTYIFILIIFVFLIKLRIQYKKKIYVFLFNRVYIISFLAKKKKNKFTVVLK